MITAKDIMTADIVSIRQDARTFDAISLMIRHRVSGLPVVDADDRLVGMISEFDLLILLCDCEEIESDVVQDYMTASVRRVGMDTDWKEVAEIFRTSKIRRLPVTKDDRLVGIVSRHDLIRGLQRTRAPARPSEPAKSTAPVGLDCHVLMVEDGEANSRFLAHALKKAGARATVSWHGQSAVEKVTDMLRDPRKDQFDIVLMDMDMPVMDGYEATKRLRAIGFDRPIIALTGQTRSYDRQKCLEAGCDDYLAKPYDRRKLVKMISDQLAAAGQESGDSRDETRTEKELATAASP